MAAAVFSIIAATITSQPPANAQKTTPAIPTTEYHVYNNSKLGIKIDSDWFYKEINNTAITFVTEKTLPSTSYRAAVVVSVENVPKGMSLDVFTQGNMKDMQQNSPSFHLITSNSTTLDGNPAHQIVFTSKPPTGSDLRKGMEIWTLKNGKAYIIVYRAEPGLDKFPILLPVVKHMIDSFQITK